MAAGLGLEPRYIAPEATVLPLDDPAMRLFGASAEEADIPKKLIAVNFQLKIQ